MAAMSGAWLCKKVRHPWLGASFDYVLGDARLRDLKPELEQLAVNAWRAPKVGSRYSSAGSARAAPSRLAAALPVYAISNASSDESRPCANARAARAA